MYSYVSKAVVKPRKKFCLAHLGEAKNLLKARYGLVYQVTLIGSGRHSLVTRWGTDPYDMDFNLIFSNLPESYLKNPGILKDTLRRAHDETLTEYGFSHGQDSTSSICYRHEKGRRTDYLLDIGIIYRDRDGDFNRLIHQKGAEGCFIWNKAPQSAETEMRTRDIKESGRWNDLRKVYLELKKENGRGSDKPSFIIYIEAVNLVWQSIPEKERMKNE